VVINQAKSGKNIAFSADVEEVSTVMLYLLYSLDEPDKKSLKSFYKSKSIETIQ